jgi:hypothetical protein
VVNQRTSNFETEVHGRAYGVQRHKAPVLQHYYYRLCWGG